VVAAANCLPRGLHPTTQIITRTVPFHAADHATSLALNLLRNGRLLRLPQTLPSLTNLPRHPSQALHPHNLDNGGADADMMHHTCPAHGRRYSHASARQVGRLTHPLPIWCSPLLPSRTCSSSPPQHCHKQQPAVCADAVCCPVLSQDAQDDDGARPTQPCPCPTPHPVMTPTRSAEPVSNDSATRPEEDGRHHSHN
jgi:hypothetical protein